MPTLTDLRAQLAREDARHDARLRAILKPPQRRHRATTARPAWLPALPLKPIERRRLNDELLNRTLAKRRRKSATADTIGN